MESHTDDSGDDDDVFRKRARRPSSVVSLVTHKTTQLHSQSVTDAGCVSVPGKMRTTVTAMMV